MKDNIIVTFVLFIAIWLCIGTAVATNISYELPDIDDRLSWKETDWSKYIATEKGGVAEYRLPDDSRVDVLTDKVAWEVEWVDKWPESIGQALFYAASTDREPGVILLMRGPKAEENYLECLTVINGLRQHFPFRLEIVYTEDK